MSATEQLRIDGAVSMPRDRIGQVWRAKKLPSNGEVTITGWRETPDARAYDGLWEIEGTNVFGKPFACTVGEAVLKRDWERVSEPSPAPSGDQEGDGR